VGGFFSNLVDTVTDEVTKALGGKVDKPNQTDSASGSPLYNPIPQNWYQSKPYAFKAKRGNETYVFYLPINPKNINIVTHFATNVISTLYGTVEEHSEQRYFDITISGTTGFAPQFTKESVSAKTGTSTAIGSGGRKRYDDFSVFSLAGGFGGKTIGKIQNTLNQANTALNALGNTNNYKTGIFNNSSGYVAFHNFYKFLLQYKKDAVKSGSLTNPPKESMGSSSSTNAPLLFVNYKDNNQYSCAVQRFTLERSAEDPMLYNYSIQIRAYDLSPIISETSPILKDRYKDLGLDSTLSIAAKAKVAINAGKSALSSARGAVKTLGA
jgi:hypothetical protein